MGVPCCLRQKKQKQKSDENLGKNMGANESVQRSYFINKKTYEKNIDSGKSVGESEAKGNLVWKTRRSHGDTPKTLEIQTNKVADKSRESPTLIQAVMRLQKFNVPNKAGVINELTNELKILIE